MAGCSHPSGIVGTWKYEFPPPNFSNVRTYTTFNVDGTFHIEGRDSDRGQPIARARGRFTLNGSQLTEDIDAQGVADRSEKPDRQVWRVTISGDTLTAVAEAKLGGASVTWHRVY